MIKFPRAAAGAKPKSDFYGKCDVAAGFSPPFAEATDITKCVQWKAEQAFRYIDCTDFDKPVRNWLNDINLLKIQYTLNLIP